MVELLGVVYSPVAPTPLAKQLKKSAFAPRFLEAS
jgi:hypothetical protein